MSRELFPSQRECLCCGAEVSDGDDRLAGGEYHRLCTTVSLGCGITLIGPAMPQHNSHRLDVSLRRDFLDCPGCSTRVAERVLGADEAFFWCSSDYLTTASSNNVDSDGAAAACCVLLVIVLRLPLL